MPLAWPGEEDGRRPVVLAAGPALPAAVGAALAALAPGTAPGAALVAPAGRPGGRGDDSAGLLVAAVRERLGAGVTVVRPPGGLRRAVEAAPVSGRWQAVAGARPGARLERVLVRRDLATAPTLAAAVLLDPADPPRRSPVIGLWSAFVHPRHAVPARLAGPDAALAADLAAAFAPRLALVVAAVRLGDGWVVAATRDLVAAELVALALLAEARADPEPLGPWQDPVVQRATELDLGVALPGQLALVLAAGGPTGASGGHGIAGLAERLRLLLGVPFA